MYYPILLKVAGRRVVVVGGGVVAEGKVESLIEAGACVTVVSPQITSRLEIMATAGEISVVKRPYEATDLNDALFVIAATDDPEVQQRVWDDAHARRISVNTVDEPERCDFITPGIIRRGDLIVAISTSGKSPAFTSWLRKRLEAIVTEDLGRIVSLLGSIRGEVQGGFHTMAERKRVYERVIASEIANSQTLSRRLLAPTSPGGRGGGSVFLVGAGPGDPDLITVKALRCLRQADVVLHDRLVDRRLLEEVRPDAMIIDVGKRKGTEDAQQARIHELMVKYAADGLIVCRLKGGDPFVFGRLSEETVC
jgi:uroporphyrin-III C-methyltransferase/precorrin-2 dehydrogenase/sirohydrochlorin ferrochelatase